MPVLFRWLSTKFYLNYDKIFPINQGFAYKMIEQFDFDISLPKSQLIVKFIWYLCHLYASLPVFIYA